jgi:hypothetical protein
MTSAIIIAYMPTSNLRRLLAAACALLKRRWGIDQQIGGPMGPGHIPPLTAAVVPSGSSQPTSPSHASAVVTMPTSAFGDVDMSVRASAAPCRPSDDAGSLACFRHWQHAGEGGAAATGGWVVPMAALQLPPLPGFASTPSDAARLNGLLRSRFRIEVRAVHTYVRHVAACRQHCV